MQITPQQIRAIRSSLPRGLATIVPIHAVAERVGISRQTWMHWERAGISSAGPVAIVRLLCVEQGLLGVDDDFSAWVASIPLGESEAA